MKRNIVALLGAASVGVLGFACSSQSQSPQASEPATTEAPAAPASAGKLDHGVARLMRASTTELTTLAKRLRIDFESDGSPVFHVLVKTHGGSAPLSLAGVTEHARAGNIVIATATREGIASLGINERVERVEASRVKTANNEVGAGESSIQLSSITTAGTPATAIPFVATAGQKVTFKMQKAGAALATPSTIPTLTSTIKVCSDAACTTVLATATANDAGGDARVTHTFVNAGTYYIQGSGAASETGTFAITYIGDSKNGVAYGSKAHATANDGTGVIVGVVDTGIDWCHPDFIDPVTGKSRILFLWDQSLTPQGTEKGPVEIASSKGVEYSSTDINAALASCKTATRTGVRHTDTGGHGTHVSGTAAGNGQGTNDAVNEPAGKYAGEAPKADIIVVSSIGVTNGDPNQGLVYIQKKAKALGKAFVINNSYGVPLGGADGTSLDEQVISSVAGQGGIAVVASGNIGNTRTHATSPATVPAIGTADSFALKMLGCTAATDAGAGTCDQRLLLMYTDGKDSFDVKLTGSDGSSYTFLASAADPSNGINATIQGLQVTTYADTSPEPDGNKEIEIVIPAAIADIATAGEFWTLGLTRTAGSTGTGKWDAYAYLPGQAGTMYFNETSTAVTGPHVARTLETNGYLSYQTGLITSPATAFGVLAVGATAAANYRWLDNTKTGGGYTEPSDTFITFLDTGDFTYFSSRGPTRDGRPFPQIGAPGMNIMSTLSRDANPAEFPKVLQSRDGQHVAISGTSMATPNVTGAIALILQSDPTNFPRPLIKNSAVHDTLTAGTNGWDGAGKLDVKNALALLATDKAPTIGSFTINPTTVAAGGQTTLTVVAHDPDGDATIEEYLWDFDGDGATDQFTTTGVVSLTADSPATKTTYTTKVIVVDKYGRTVASTASLTVGAAPVVDGGTDASADASSEGGIGTIGGDAGKDSGATPDSSTGPVGDDDSGTVASDSGTGGDSSVGDDDSGIGPIGSDAGGDDVDAAADAGPGNPGDSSGCSCTTAGKDTSTQTSTYASLGGLAGILALGMRRRRRVSRVNGASKR